MLDGCHYKLVVMNQNCLCSLQSNVSQSSVGVRDGGGSQVRRGQGGGQGQGEGGGGEAEGGAESSERVRRLNTVH